jgi:hypothetical protein
MRKLVCVSMIVAFLVSMTVVLAIAQGGKVGTKLTKENAKLLKGTWQGNMFFGTSIQCLFVMTVDNDAPPFKGKLSMQNIPAELQTQIAAGFSGNTYEGPFDNGLITNKGTLIISGQGGNFGEWTLKGEKQLNGWFYFYGTQGTFNLKKK